MMAVTVPRSTSNPTRLDNNDVSNPPGIQVSDANHLQLYVCPTCYTHTDLIQ